MEGFKAENLKDNAAFLTVVVRASRAAAATHRQEKLDALRNAVLNYAAAGEPDDDWAQLYISWVDRLQPWHLKILALFDDPEEWVRRHGIVIPPTPRSEMRREVILLAAFPDLEGQQRLYRQLVMELHQLGLVENNNVQDPLHDQVFRRMTTDTGRNFLAFITAPEEKKKDARSA